MSRSAKRFAFCLAVIALPVLQFLIFWVYVNFNSILMAFRTYVANADGNGYTVTFAGFANIASAAKVFAENIYMLKNSLILYAVQLFIGLPLELLFAYYIYKKHFMSGAFKVALFLPQIVSSVVMCLLFRFVVNKVYTHVTGAELGLLANNSTRFATIIFYSIWMAFGVNVIMFTGAMSGIDNSIVESAELDGVTPIQEFLHISLPMIFPTVVTFVVVGLSGVFTNQMHLYTFFGSSDQTYSKDISTFGFYLYVQAQNSGVVVANGSKALPYSVLSALGVMLTLIIFPITLLVRHLLNKFGPSED